MQFWKYHALGNDYLVLEPDGSIALNQERIRLLCHRHFGLGSDGILEGLHLPGSAVFEEVCVAAGIAGAEAGASLGALRILNPDGSEAEKSGNGLRIFARYLYDIGRVAEDPFRLITLGGLVTCRCFDGGRHVRVEMGAVTFESGEIPVRGPSREVLKESVTVGGDALQISAASVGNPHCVIVCDKISETLARTLGPLLETDARFPNRTNVQFMEVLDEHTVGIEIWERGAGYTLASGSSASACAAIACRLGLCRSPVTVRMPGGDLSVEIDASWRVTQTGPVTAVARGTVACDLLEELRGQPDPFLRQ
jgi:diaminopimelate epimerase